MKSDIPDNKHEKLLEDPEDLTTTSPDQERINDDLTAGAPGDRQTDESPTDLTAGLDNAGHVDESLYDELMENSSANDQIENIDNLYDELIETPETGPELFFRT